MSALKTILLVGAGEANLAVLRKAQVLARSGAKIILVSEDAYWYAPTMAAEVMSGRYGLEDFRLDLAALTRRLGVEFVHDQVTSLLPKQKKVLTASGRLLAYDVAAFAIGAGGRDKEHDIPAEGSFPVRPVRNVLEIRNEVETLLELFPGKTLEVVVLGGGRRGVEYALNTAALLQHRRRHTGDPGWSLTLLERQPRLLPAFSSRAAKAAARQLVLMDVQVRTKVEVEHIQSRRLVLEHGETVEYDIAIVATGRRVADIFQRAELPTDENNAIFVEPTLAVAQAPDMFATGDCSRPWGAPRSAVWQGRLLLRNLQAWLQGRPLRSLRVHAGWQHLSLGPDAAMALRGGWLLQGAWVAGWKHRQEQHALRSMRQLRIRGI